MLNVIKRLFTDHLNDTDVPQTYIEHGMFAGVNSVIIIFAGFLGIIHAIFPFMFKFNTSTVIIRSFGKLLRSGRHTDELKSEGIDKYLK